MQNILVRSTSKLAGAMLFTSVTLILTGCKSETDRSPIVNVASLLSHDDPKACAADTVIQTALRAANRDYGSFIERGGEAVKVTTISATHINKDIHEVTCNAVMNYKMGGEGSIWQVPIAYKISPALDTEDSFVVAMLNPNPMKIALMSHMASVKIQEQTKNSLAPDSDDPDVDSTVAMGIINNRKGEPEPDYSEEVCEKGEKSARRHTVWSPAENQLIEQYRKLETQCREETNPAVAEKVCEERDADDSPLKLGLKKANICFGHESQCWSQYDFHRCETGSLQL